MAAAWQVKDIEALQKLFDETAPENRFYQTEQKWIFRCQDVVLKVSLNDLDYEADVLRYIRKETSIPVPQVIQLSTLDCPGSDVIFHMLVLEYIPGTTLEYAWKTLSDTEKDSYSAQLRTIVEELLPNVCCGKSPVVDGNSPVLDASARLEYTTLSLNDDPKARTSCMHDFMRRE